MRGSLFKTLKVNVNIRIFYVCYLGLNIVRYLQSFPGTARSGGSGEVQGTHVDSDIARRW